MSLARKKTDFFWWSDKKFGNMLLLADTLVFRSDMNQHSAIHIESPPLTLPHLPLSTCK
jgi:hypothetical protein